MVYCAKEISKEVYDRAVANNGRIAREDINDVFDISILCGYGSFVMKPERD